jgi:hypothetical protein
LAERELAIDRLASAVDAGLVDHWLQHGQAAGSCRDMDVATTIDSRDSFTINRELDSRNVGSGRRYEVVRQRIGRAALRHVDAWIDTL